MKVISKKEVLKMIESGELLSRTEYARLRGWDRWGSMQEQNYSEYYCDEDRESREYVIEMMMKKKRNLVK